jgi:hypothetical protein
VNGTLLVALVALLANHSVSAAARENEPAADPAATREALAALLVASNDAIPSRSSCAGSYGQAGRATVKDLLSVQFASLYRGENVVDGRCERDGGRCTLTIRHANGDDLSSARISFTARHGKAQVASLACIITP